MTRKASKAAMMIEILRRNMRTNIGEAKLAHAVIAQAIRDADDYASGRRADVEPHGLLDFISRGCDPYASLIGLDPEFVVSIINHKSPGDIFGMIDRVRNRLSDSVGAAGRRAIATGRMVAD